MAHTHGHAEGQGTEKTGRVLMGRAPLWTAIVGAALGASSLTAQELRTVTASRQHRGETAFNLDVRFVAGVLKLRPGSVGELYRMRLRYDEEHFEPVARFNQARSQVVLGVEKLEGVSWDYDEDRHEYQELSISITPEVPTALDLIFGAGRAEVELGDLSLTDVSIKTGASETEVRWSSPNRIAGSRLEFVVGAVKFSAYGIGNAGCRDLRFKGGVGEMDLDLSGSWTTDATVDIDLALGDLTLRIPRNVAVEVDLDRFLAGFEDRRFTKRGDRYVSYNWDDAPTRIRMTIDAVISDIDVIWVAPR